MQKTKREFITYLFTGSANTAFTYFVYGTFVFIGANFLLANLIAWTAGVVLSFILSSRFVFRKNASLSRFLKFAMSNVLGLLISNITLGTLIVGFGANPYLAPLVAIPLVVISNFVTQKYFVFSGRES